MVAKKCATLVNYSEANPVEAHSTVFDFAASICPVDHLISFPASCILALVSSPPSFGGNFFCFPDLRFDKLFDKLHRFFTINLAFSFGAPSSSP